MKEQRDTWKKIPTPELRFAYSVHHLTMPRIRPKGICHHCKQFKAIQANELCPACYVYLWRTKTDRPQRLIKRIESCCDCKEGVAFAKGRCVACCNYFAINGKKRPAHLRNKATMDCRNPNCRKPLRLCKRKYRGYCSHCFEYRQRNDNADRPARYARFELEPGYVACQNPNCDKPLKIGRTRGTRCHACLRWIRANFEDRPRALCPQRVNIGWCECGEVATREEGELILCEACYEWYNSVYPSFNSNH